MVNSYIYNSIQNSILNGEKLVAVLVGPDTFPIENVAGFVSKVNASITTHIFLGGSTVKTRVTHGLVTEIKKHTQSPVVLFPGDITQINNQTDALLFLSLISGRNPDYLLGKYEEAVSKLRKIHFEVIPTGYILIENSKQTSVETVTETKPISRNNIQKIVDTAKSGELLGMKLICLEAGSGALESIAKEIISAVKKRIKHPAHC